MSVSSNNLYYTNFDTCVHFFIVNAAPMLTQLLQKKENKNLEVKNIYFLFIEDVMHTRIHIQTQGRNRVMCKILMLIRNRTRILQLKLQEREIVQKLRLLKKKKKERKKWPRQFVQRKLKVVKL